MYPGIHDNVMKSSGLYKFAGGSMIPGGVGKSGGGKQPARMKSLSKKV